MKPATPEAQLNAAKAIAKRHGLFISARGGKFHVWRNVAPRPVHLGFRRTESHLFDYVERLTHVEAKP